MGQGHNKRAKKGGTKHAERIYRYVQRKRLADPSTVPERYRNPQLAMP